MIGFHKKWNIFIGHLNDQQFHHRHHHQFCVMILILSQIISITKSQIIDAQTTIALTTAATNVGPIDIVNQMIKTNDSNLNLSNLSQQLTSLSSASYNHNDSIKISKINLNNKFNQMHFRPLKNHSEFNGNVGKVKEILQILTTTTATTTTKQLNFNNNQVINKSNDIKFMKLIKNQSNHQDRNDINSTTTPTSIPTTMMTHSSVMLTNRRFKVNEVFEKERKKYHNKIHSSGNTSDDDNINNENDDNIGDGNNKKIILLGLFELTTKFGLRRPEGFSELGAAQMAVQHINKKKLLPGYTLELLTNDTQCDPGVGVDRFFHALYTQNTTRMVMLLGSACSEVTESLAKIVPYWNIVQVSFGSTSPALSDRQEFPFFYRTVAPDSSHNPARIAFIRKFGWDTVTTFSQNEEVHSLAVNDLVTELELSNISCAATITFAETDFKEQLHLLRDLDTRIIIGSFSQELAPKIFCEAYKLGMFGADYAWILHDTIGAPWRTEKNNNYQKSSDNDDRNDCHYDKLREAVQNLIIVSSHNSIVGNKIGLSGLNNNMFSNELKLKVPEPISRYAPQTYDAVWAIALALRGAEEHWRQQTSNNHSQLYSFDYTRYDMAMEFLDQLGKLDFLGVSGPVSFSGPDRIGTTAFYQYQMGSLKPVALYYPAEHNLDFQCPNCQNIKWYSGQVPIAKRIFKVRIVTISPIAFYTISIVSSVGIALSLAFLAFNLHFRKLKAIKLSSPKLSNITAFGCILVYAAVILLGLDYSTLPLSENVFSRVCTARVYLLSAGFSLAFGSMFAKTYRVHRLFTRAHSGVCKNKMLQDTQLISLVCALLVLDGLVVTLWIATDPIERHLNNLTLEISATDRSVVYQPQVEVCRSQHTEGWLGALYAYKGLLLVVGVYMAWETRHVKISALNDSQYIGVSVYSVVITSALVVVLANLISERVTLAFITITALILASTTSTLCLLFIPKLHDIWARNDVVDPIIHSMGLKMEYNTRRFVLDDRRELQYRVEVQNRVYKKELLALDAEIYRLEKLLDSNSVSSSSNISLTPFPPKSEITVITETGPSIPTPQIQLPKSRTPSITGGLPYLLLSVLPPVIPRASWPSAEYMQIPMRRSVTFASQPQLENSRSMNEVCLPAADLFNLRLAHQQATENKGGIINRIRGIFSRHSSSNKGSSGSLSNCQPQHGLRAAFKSHMGMFSRLIPNTETASCNAIYNNQTKFLNPMEKSQLAKSGTHLDRTQVDPEFLNPINIDTSTDEPVTTTTTELYVTKSETKVNFQLPLNRRPSIISSVQSTLRERVKGSPRFPHRILPTSSLTALEEQDTPKLSSSDRLRIRLDKTSNNWKSEEVSHSKFSINDNDDDHPVTDASENNQQLIYTTDKSSDKIYVVPDNDET